MVEYMKLKLSIGEGAGTAEIQPTNLFPPTLVEEHTQGYREVSLFLLNRPFLLSMDLVDCFIF